MKAVRSRGLVLLLPALAALASGCDGADERKRTPRPARLPGGLDTVAAKPVKSSGTGTVVGKVVYDGSRPEMKFIAAMQNHQDSAVCLAGSPDEKKEQFWIVGDSGGVANAVIYIEPSDGFYFPVEDKQRELKGKFAEIDQPHCAFTPHVVAFYSNYYDPKSRDWLRTGKILKVLNNSKAGHNVKSKEFNYPVPSGGYVDVNAVTSSNAMPMKVECSIHSWMNAYIWAMDTPYFAVTRADGQFEIKGVPAGAKVRVLGWHEAREWFSDFGGQNGRVIEIAKDGDKFDLGTIKIK
jgi:hypothetical protein